MAKPAQVLRVCIIDMNAGEKNEAMRCLRGLASRFAERVHATQSDVRIEMVEVCPRGRKQSIPRDASFYLCSGGPGSPFDGEGQDWDADFGDFISGLVNQPRDAVERSAFAICYSYELVVRHLDFAKLVARAHKKFGVMPVYLTTPGQAHPLLNAFGDRLFAFEHRSWNVLEVNADKLASIGGAVLARESREGLSDKGEGIVAFHVGDALEATLFHPEADRAGIQAWISKPEQEAAFREAYGDLTHSRMLRTVDNPERIDRTHMLVIPSWFERRFNALAQLRGFAPLIKDAP